MSPSASIDHFELCEISLCQIALPAPLRQCLASTSACVTQTGPVRHGKHRPPWSCILCRGISTGLPEGLSPEMSMTRRRQTKQTGVLAYPHFLFAIVTRRRMREVATRARRARGRNGATGRSYARGSDASIGASIRYDAANERRSKETLSVPP